MIEGSINQDVSVKGAENIISPYLWLLFFLCFLGNILGGTVTTLMSVYLPSVISSLSTFSGQDQISGAGALINAVYFAGWAIGGLTWGFISDRTGRAKSLAMAIGMFGICTLMTSMAASWTSVMIWRFLSGFGVGGMLVINTTLLSEEWPEVSRTIFIGILSIGFPVGIFSSGAINYLIADWHKGFLLGIIPMLTGLVIYLVLKESNNWKEAGKGKETGQVSWRTREHRTNLFYGSVIFGCMLIGLWAIFSWMPSWVQGILRGSDGQHERGITMMLLGTGGLAGGFLSGWISRIFGTRRTMALCYLGCFLFSVALFGFNTQFTMITMLEIAVLSVLFGISQGMLSFYIPLLFPVIIRASATGFCFNTGRFFTAAAVFFVGTLVTAFGGFANSLIIFSSVFVIGLVFILVSKK